jgi:hypothetical protein
VPMRPPVHLGDGVGVVGFVVGVVGFASVSHCPERVGCVPAGQPGGGRGVFGVVSVPLLGVAPPVPVLTTQAPRGCFRVRSKCVPAGQLGGRGVFGCVSVPLLGVAPPVPGSTTQAPRGCLSVRPKCVPTGQPGGGRGVLCCVSNLLLVVGAPAPVSATHAPRGGFTVGSK